jgi:SpoU rRNA methylase family enzyme
LVELRLLAAGEPAGEAAADAVRRALVEALSLGDRAGLVPALDEALLGLRPRPVRQPVARALAG